MWILCWCKFWYLWYSLEHCKNELTFAFLHLCRKEIYIFVGGKKKVKSAYGAMWPTRPELIPVSVA